VKVLLEGTLYKHTLRYECAQLFHSAEGAVVVEEEAYAALLDRRSNLQAASTPSMSIL
jgi:hypothetical protein